MFQPVSGQKDLWRCPTLKMDRDAMDHLIEAFGATDSFEEAFAELFVFFADEGNKLSGEPGLFRKHGAGFRRLGKYKAMMFGSPDEDGTVGIGWTLRRVD